MNRLKEAQVLSDVSPINVFQLFLDQLKQVPRAPRRYRAPKSHISHYVEGARPKASKRPRWTAKTNESLKLAIADFQSILNTVYASEAPIYIENKVDLECK